MDNFDLKKFLLENKLTPSSLKNEVTRGNLAFATPDIEEGITKIVKSWNEWKQSNSSSSINPEIVEQAKRDILAYLSERMK